MIHQRVLPSNVLSPDISGPAFRALKGVDLTDNFAMMTVSQAARFLQMSEAWLYQSDVPFVRIDRARRYRRIDLIAFTEQRLSRTAELVRG